jgi:cell wall-associated NlpC family hydrolase
MILIAALFGAVMFTGCSPSIRFAENTEKTSYKKKAKSQKQRKESSKCVASTSSSSEKDKQEEDDYFKELERLSDCNKTEYTSSIGLLREAKSWIGTRYVYGGESKSGTDCSGFVQSVFSAAGVSLPRTAARQFDYTERISASDAEIGDLVFFTDKGRVSHVGFYAGNGMMIHASSSKGVVLEKINKPCYLNIAGYGRVPGLVTVK